MNLSTNQSTQGRRLLQLGVGLLLFTSFEGFFIEHLATPMVGRSTHTLAALVAILFLAMGLLWPKLVLRDRAAAVAFWCLSYSGLAIVAAFLLAAIWGAGQTTMPLSGAQLGTRPEETILAIISYSTAPTGIVAFALILLGLRG